MRQKYADRMLQWPELHTPAAESGSKGTDFRAAVGKGCRGQWNWAEIYPLRKNLAQRFRVRKAGGFGP
ncbi:MAG TPA: hypothetical protein PKD78_15090, partial [Saprospiraceae bacterium]|nr:hypothetical protein [Saprospiraceae bacterium]